MLKSISETENYNIQETNVYTTVFLYNDYRDSSFHQGSLFQICKGGQEDY